MGKLEQIKRTTQRIQFDQFSNLNYMNSARTQGPQDLNILTKEPAKVWWNFEEK